MVFLSFTRLVVYAGSRDPEDHLQDDELTVLEFATGGWKLCFLALNQYHPLLQRLGHEVATAISVKWGRTNERSLESDFFKLQRRDLTGASAREMRMPGWQACLKSLSPHIYPCCITWPLHLETIKIKTKQIYVHGTRLEFHWLHLEFSLLLLEFESPWGFLYSLFNIHN